VKPKKSVMRAESCAYVRAVYTAHPELRPREDFTPDPYPARPSRPLLPRGGLKKIIDFVSRQTGYTPDELRGQCRSRGPVRARCEVSILAIKKGYSLAEIGKALNKDHTTIHHYLKIMGVR
jgi:hypothetical protein